VAAFTDIGNWVVALATILIVSLVIGVHYEVLRGCIRFLPRVSRQRRRRVLLLILVILATHAAEIWLFAFGYYFLLEAGGFGELAGTSLSGLADYAYYSGMVYTTVGFGDIVPGGAIRFMTGMEALTGLVMITWSASFTFLEMQRDWPARSGGTRDPD
jgi:hypothetical protein